MGRITLNNDGAQMNMRNLPCPPFVKDSLERYWEQRVPTGGFLRAVLENKLFEAFGRADLDDQRDMFHIVKWIWNNLPTNIYGSPENVKKHLEGEKEDK